MGSHSKLLTEREVIEVWNGEESLNGVDKT